MSYMIMVYVEGAEIYNEYSGTEYNTVEDALAEYFEAVKDFDVNFAWIEEV